jgi:hypothetical protein
MPVGTVSSQSPQASTLKLSPASSAASIASASAWLAVGHIAAEGSPSRVQLPADRRLVRVVDWDPGCGHAVENAPGMRKYRVAYETEPRD